MIIGQILEGIGVPHPMVKMLRSMCESQPILPKERKLDESKVEEINFLQRKLDDVKSEFDEPASKVDHVKITILPATRGVPQGSNLGPTLSILVLKGFLSQQHSLSYADDGLFFSNEPFVIQDRPFTGITIHPGKSGWVR